MGGSKILRSKVYFVHMWAFMLMRVYVIINMHEHLALLTEGSCSNGEEPSCTTPCFNCKDVCVVTAACTADTLSLLHALRICGISANTVPICNHSVHIHVHLLLYNIRAVCRSLIDLTQ